MEKETALNSYFADRIADVPRSFIREILKVALDKDIISFAGGLPNRDLFPVAELDRAARMVFEIDGADALQYSNSEGFPDLRSYISKRYREKRGLDVPVENILITSGSQQGLDLLGKVFLNENDEVIIEEPGYLGAIQAFLIFRASFCPVKLENDGLDTRALEDVLIRHNPKLMYMVPNFQNPSGATYSAENRRRIADIVSDHGIYIIEDDPYGELRFSGSPIPGFKTFLPERTLMLGSFSKTVVPAFRIGWIAAPDDIMNKLIVAKQASDLHTNSFCQRLLNRYLTCFDNEEHIRTICHVYGRQKDAMIAAMQNYFPGGVRYTNPEGGMFLWVTLPDGSSSMELFNKAVKRGVVFVPGNPFYTNLTGDVNTLRLNFSCSNEETIDAGIRILGESMKEILG